MRAFVYRRIDGRDVLGTAGPITVPGSGARVTPEYQSKATMIRYFLAKLPPGEYHVEAFCDFTNRKYGKPDMDFIYHRT
jgi:hypothetical protein